MKKAAGRILAGILLLGLTACGGKTADAGKTTTTLKGTTTAAITTTTEPKETTTEAVTATTEPKETTTEAAATTEEQTTLDETQIEEIIAGRRKAYETDRAAYCDLNGYSIRVFSYPLSKSSPYIGFHYDAQRNMVTQIDFFYAHDSSATTIESVEASDTNSLGALIQKEGADAAFGDQVVRTVYQTENCIAECFSIYNLDSDIAAAMNVAAYVDGMAGSSGSGILHNAKFVMGNVYYSHKEYLPPIFYTEDMLVAK